MTATPSGRPGPVLRVDDLRVSYAGRVGPVDAVRGASFELAPGEVLGLVGESGSGKSSVARCLLGLIEPPASVSAATLELDGVDLRALDERGWRAQRGRRIALVPQQPMTALSPLTAVGRQLEWYLGRDAVDRHADALRDLGLDAVVERPHDRPAAFSGGQLQRLVLAVVTLAATPAVLVADEPTSTLDTAVAASVLDLLDDLRARLGLAVLHISHDLGSVARRCDRVAVMQHGRIVETGLVEAVFAAPEHPYTRLLLDASPRRSAPRGVARRPADQPAGPPASHSVRSAPPRLELDRLYHYFGGRPVPGAPRAAGVVRAVDEVSLRVAEGEVVAVVGESGSGKTTLARVVAGALAPTAGVVRLDGRELAGTRALADRRAVQLVVQDVRSALNRRRRLGHAFDQAQRVHGIGFDRADRRARAASWLERVGLSSDHLDRRPGALSGGELARAVLVRSLLVEPRLLVLDEPTGSLDAETTRSVVALLDHLRSELDLTMLLITHELGVARSLADRVVVIERGRVAEEGATAEVFAHPQADASRALLAAWPGRDRDQPAGISSTGTASSWEVSTAPLPAKVYTP